MKILKIRILISLLFALQLSQAQQTIPISGGEAISDSGTVSYTVGQMVYTTNEAVDGSMHQGINQGIDEGIEMIMVSDPTVVIFPNPTTDYVVLSFTDTSLSGVNYSLFDIQGRLITAAAITQNSTSIGLDRLNSAIYILRVSQNNRELKTFKIIKK